MGSIFLNIGQILNSLLSYQLSFYLILTNSNSGNQSIDTFDFPLTSTPAVSNKEMAGHRRVSGV